LDANDWLLYYTFNNDDYKNDAFQCVPPVHTVILLVKGQLVQKYGFWTDWKVLNCSSGEKIFEFDSIDLKLFKFFYLI